MYKAFKMSIISDCHLMLFMYFAKTNMTVKQTILKWSQIWKTKIWAFKCKIFMTHLKTLEVFVQIDIPAKEGMHKWS